MQWLLGDAAMQIEIGRLLTMRAADKLDRGDFARKEVSMAKVAVADALHQCVDTAIQLNGARGYSKDTPLEWIYRYARQARLVDGASEVHKMVLARSFMEERGDFWRWDALSAGRRPALVATGRRVDCEGCRSTPGGINPTEAGVPATSSVTWPQLGCVVTSLAPKVRTVVSRPFTVKVPLAPPRRRRFRSPRRGGRAAYSAPVNVQGLSAAEERERERIAPRARSRGTPES